MEWESSLGFWNSHQTSVGMFCWFLVMVVIYAALVLIVSASDPQCSKSEFETGQSILTNRQHHDPIMLTLTGSA